MKGPIRGGWAVLALVVLPAFAEGHWGCWQPPYHMHYSPWPLMPPVAYMPPQPPFAPLPPAPQQPKDIPNQPERRGPTVHELRSSGSDHIAKKQTSKGRYRVGFWNVTGRDVRLTVDGQERMLPRDRSITIDLPRAFAWQIDEGRPRNETVPEGQATFEVVIRP